jgi:hypothetical protein
MGKIITVKDNFLPKDLNQQLQNLVNSNNFDWYFEPRSLVRVDDGNYMFVHKLLSKSHNHESQWFSMFKPMLKTLADIVPFTDCLRMKINCYPNRDKIYEHAKHVDFLDFITKKPPHNLVTCIYNFTTCNGYTVVGDEKFISKQNQIIIFDGDIEHYGATATNVENRIVLNINIIKDE